MKTTIAALLGIAIGALLVFLFRPQTTIPPPASEVGRYQFISSTEMTAGMYDRVLDTTSGKIYTRIWAMQKDETGDQKLVTFMVIDPVGMSTTAERTVNAQPEKSPRP